MAKKILITDDDHDLVEVMKEWFETEGYNIVTAYEGEECITQAKKEQPDLIIIDINMPKMDGYSAVREIKADEAIKNIPIIVLTGKDQMEDIFKAEGVKEYVVKPFEYEVISQMVKKILEETTE